MAFPAPDTHIQDAVAWVRSRQNRESAALFSEAVRLAAELSKNGSIRRVILFGSVAAGKADVDSDIDLAVVADVDHAVAPHQRLQQEYLRLNTSRRVDFLVYTPEEFTALEGTSSFLRDEIILRGKVLYERT